MVNERVDVSGEPGPVASAVPDVPSSGLLYVGSSFLVSLILEGFYTQSPCYGGVACVQMKMITLQYGERFGRLLHYVDGPYYCSVRVTDCDPPLRSLVREWLRKRLRKYTKK